MTITSGRAWAATATASRAELASAHDHVLGLVEEQPDAVADDLVVVDQHDPQRWRAHDLSSQGPLGGLAVGVAVSGRIRLDASFVPDSLDGSVGHGPIRDCLAEPVEEVRSPRPPGGAAPGPRPGRPRRAAGGSGR